MACNAIQHKQYCVLELLDASHVGTTGCVSNGAFLRCLYMELTLDKAELGTAG